jgi:hypothetical protein
MQEVESKESRCRYGPRALRGYGSDECGRSICRYIRRFHGRGATLRRGEGDRAYYCRISPECDRQRPGGAEKRRLDFSRLAAAVSAVRCTDVDQNRANWAASRNAVLGMRNVPQMPRHAAASARLLLRIRVGSRQAVRVRERSLCLRWPPQSSMSGQATNSAKAQLVGLPGRRDAMPETLRRFAGLKFTNSNR